MTLTDFLTTVSYEVLLEEKLLANNNFTKNNVNSISTNDSCLAKKIITEKLLNSMINDGTVSNLSLRSRFTPLALDIYKDYIKRVK